MTLEMLKPVLDPTDWTKVVKKAEKVEKKTPFPLPTLKYSEIGTRWSSDHKVIIGMRTKTVKASTGFVQLNQRIVDRVFQVPWPS